MLFCVEHFIYKCSGFDACGINYYDAENNQYVTE